MKWGCVNMVACFSLLAHQGLSKYGNKKCSKGSALNVSDSLFTKNIKGVCDFGNNLLHQVFISSPKDQSLPRTNQMISSLSIGTALAMVEEGSNGKTKKELLKTLGLTQKVKETFRRLILETNEAEQSNLTVSLANGIFVKKNSVLNPDFKRNIQCNFKGLVSNMKEKPDKQINKWIFFHTNHTIEKVVDESDLENVRVVLVNTIYFKGAWLKPFSKAPERFFAYSRKNPGVQIPFISQEEEFEFAEYPDKKIVRVPYKGNRIALYIVLPVEEGEVSLKAVLYNLPARDNTFNPEKMESKRLELIMPEFKIKTSLKLRKTLKKLGIVDAFQESSANLYGISLDNLYISEVFHKTFIEVDKDGSTAGASTAVVATVFRSTQVEPERFLVDRPFIFIIQDDLTGASLFQGVFKKPQTKKSKRKKF